MSNLHDRPAIGGGGGGGVGQGGGGAAIRQRRGDHVGYTYYTPDGVEYPSPVSWQEITAMIKALWNEDQEPEVAAQNAGRSDAVAPCDRIFLVAWLITSPSRGLCRDD